MEPFMDTKIVTVNGHALCIFLNKVYGFDTGDLAQVRITESGNPTHTVITTKKVVDSKGSKLIYLDKAWGFKKGDTVELEITPRGQIGVGDKEGDKEVS